MIFTHNDITRNIDECCDVCVIGSGAGGAVVAKELAEQGMSVIVLEEGGYFRTEDFRHHDTVLALVNLYRDAGGNVLLGKPDVMIAEGRCVGGSTTINGGMCWRTPEKILKRWQWEAGLTDMLPKRMEPLFKRVEDILSVTPVLPESRNNDAEILKRGAERLGYCVRANLRAHRSCVGTNQCLYGCPTGGKQSTLVTYIPALLKAGGRVYANCRVQKVQFKGRCAVGATGHIIDPVTKRKKFRVRIRSSVTIVCGGAIQTPLLLMRSRMPDPSRQLGEHLMVHPNAKVVGVFDEAVQGWKGVNQAYQVTEFIDEGIIMGVNFLPPSIAALAFPSFYGRGTLEKLKDVYNHCVLGAALVEDTSRGRVINLPFGQVLATYHLNRRDFDLALRAVALMSEIYFAAGAKKVYLPFAPMPEINSVDEIRKIYEYNLKMTDLELISVHIMGTCRIGADPKASVVNPFGESHEVKGLFVADASVFPTAIGVNPQETVMALATRTAFHIAENASKYLG